MQNHHEGAIAKKQQMLMPLLPVIQKMGNRHAKNLLKK
jgi:hypothetical protein